ncbi:unnamed protein product [Closterium sp. NIES-65]|nr:unnamed protein product [Closterium sp. NIES-65]
MHITMHGQPSRSDLRIPTLTGSVPASMGAMLNLQYLYVNHNATPCGYGKCEVVQYSGTAFCRACSDLCDTCSRAGKTEGEGSDLRIPTLTGSVPASMGAMLNLQYLYVNHNATPCGYGKCEVVQHSGTAFCRACSDFCDTCSRAGKTEGEGRF